jgi:hypothetical protein
MNNKNIEMPNEFDKDKLANKNNTMKLIIIKILLN